MLFATEHILNRIVFIEKVPTEGGLKLEKRFFRVRGIWIDDPTKRLVALLEPVNAESHRLTGGKMEVEFLLSVNFLS